VHSCITLCIGLVDVWARNVTAAGSQQDATKGVCDRLVAAAMKVTEIAATPGSGHPSPGYRPDIIKLESYLFMSHSLARCSERHTTDLFANVLALTERGTRHAVSAWSERMIRAHLGAVIDALDARDDSIASLLSAALEQLGGSPRHVVYAMHADMLATLSPPAKAERMDQSLWALLADTALARLHAAVDALKVKETSLNMTVLDTLTEFEIEFKRRAA
jgi:hypothetical protein